MPTSRNNRSPQGVISRAIALCVIALLADVITSTASAQTYNGGNNPRFQSRNQAAPDQPNSESRDPQIVSPGFELSPADSTRQQASGTNPAQYENQTATNAPLWSNRPVINSQQVVRGQQNLDQGGDRFSDSIPISAPDPERDSGLMTAPGGSKNGVLTTATASLVIVISLFLLLVFLTRKTLPKGNAQLPTDVVETLGRATLSNRQAMQLVKIGKKLILLSVTPTGAETLTEITDADEVQRLIALCQTGAGTSITSSFRQVLHQMGEEPAPPGFLGNEEDRPSNDSPPDVSRMETYHA
ncbi:MAG: flagellar biogenesis protein FliO [Pirellulaceae bacterium]|jgi:flagellar biogenesis protein FliO